MGEQILKWFSSIGDAFVSIWNFVLLLLPKSPFVYLDMVPAVQQVLGYVNYFVPISTCLTILEAWLLSIIGWYATMVILRWVKAVG